MGLDIMAYSNLAPVGHIVLPWCEDDDHIAAFAYDAFPHAIQAVLLEQGVHDQFLHAGCFVTTDATETHSFRAGSYGGYNRWRNDLQEQFNPDRVPDKPFYELIWFADNEGTLGPEAAAALAEDFQRYSRDYDPPKVSGRIYDPAGRRRVFDDFARAAELAANNGLIVFR